MKVLVGSLVLCFALALSSCTKKEAPPADAPAAGEQVEGSSTAPSDATPENSPEEMQKKENNGSKTE
ncbi:MAG: hypothetical protein AB7K68_07250 [Bacteriovoracia bacterium]